MTGPDYARRIAGRPYPRAPNSGAPQPSRLSRRTGPAGLAAGIAVRCDPQPSLLATGARERPGVPAAFPVTEVLA